jgi:tetratricopeptide (TPR) repeat protein
VGRWSNARSADPKLIEQAIAGYRRALQADPSDGKALFKLLRALHFKGAFCGAAPDAQKAVFDEGRQLGQAFVDRAERGLEKSKPERLAALRKIPHAAEVYFWTAACWGEWALACGKLAAARQGVAGRLRELAQTVIELDPLLEEGGGHRVLGRLHHLAPRIPFLTGWISRPRALLELRKSYAIAPQNSATRFFLAEAILDLDGKNKDEGAQPAAVPGRSRAAAEYLAGSR